MKTIVALLGDHWHDFAMLRDGLENALRVAGSVPFKIECVEHTDMLAVLREKPDGVVVYKSNRLNPTEENIKTWMTPSIALEISKYVLGGGGWLAWHTGMAGYPADGIYVQMLRGYFKYHPTQQLVTYSSPEHLEGHWSGSFTVSDEHYFVSCDIPNTEAFLISESADGNSIAGWSHSYGKGRVCCLTPGHGKGVLTNPDFMQLLALKVAWSVSG